MTYSFKHPDPNFKLMEDLEKRLKKEYRKHRKSLKYFLIERDLATVYKLISWVYGGKQEAING
jgi:hypothetical protein